METKENSKREIKFRIWDKSSKIFRGNLYKYLINADTGELEVWGFSDIYDEWYNTYDDKDLIVQQYTGLQDKNGKDIYEGDILKWHEGDHELSEVVFQNGSFFVKGVNWGALWYVGDYNDSYEIVGNVFEIPDLLK